MRRCRSSTGVVQAQAAADAANALGLGWMTPIYYDLEAYPRGGSCTTAVKNFLDGWARQLNARGYRSAMYSSLCSGVLDAAAMAGDPTKVPLNAVWMAAWNGTPKIYGYGSSSVSAVGLALERPPAGAPVHGGHNEAYGGVTINIDSNAVDGPTVSPGPLDPRSVRLRSLRGRSSAG